MTYKLLVAKTIIEFTAFFGHDNPFWIRYPAISPDGKFCENNQPEPDVMMRHEPDVMSNGP